MIITKITQAGKGKIQLSFDDACDLVLYQTEVRQFALKEQMAVSEELYRQIYYEILGKRAVKRAMHLLEKMDRTEEQLRRKLRDGKYPQELIENAVSYVKAYRYIDDDRYARTFIRLNQGRRSKCRMKADLLSRGIAEHIIERAMDEENETDQEALIRKLLEKKHFYSDTASWQEMQKIYRFLLNRGFRGSEIRHVLQFTAEKVTDVLNSECT